MYRLDVDSTVSLGKRSVKRPVEIRSKFGRNPCGRNCLRAVNLPRRPMKLLLRMLFLETRKLESARISGERGARLMTVRPTGQVRSYLSVRESLDGNGAADHDSPYTFGRAPRALAPFPF